MKTCAECGKPITSTKAHAKFCSTPCRKTVNNRRMVRGAELYDAFMALRFDRSWSKTVNMWQLICRLASDWRNEDQEAGRQSHIRPDRWVEDNTARLRCQRIG